DLDRLTRLHALQAFDDHALAAVEPAAYPPEAAAKLGELDRPRYHDAVVADDEHARAFPRELHRALRNQQRVGPHADLDAGADELPRQQDRVRIRELGAERGRAGCLVDRHVEEVEEAFVTVRRAVLQLERHAYLIERGDLERALGDLAPHLQQRRARGREVHVDRVELLDPCQERRARGADERALGYLSASGAPGDRRGHG